MTRSRSRMALVLAATVLLAAACNDKTTPTTPTTPSTPIEPTSVDYEGTLNVNGARSYGFGTLPGTVTATLTSLGPDSPLAVSLALGTWSGSVCSIVVANDNAVQGTVVTGQAGTTGALCVRISDVGNLTETLPFIVTVVHP